MGEDGLTLLSAAIRSRNLVLVGLPGAGKSSVGKRLSARLRMPFVDADCEIERAAGMSVSEIFASRGEAAFRDGEARVIARLLREGPQVIATGGGAFMAAATRSLIASDGIAIWLDASTDVLLSRIVKRNTRPLFHNVDRLEKLLALRAVRDPLFAEAPIRVMSSSGPHERVVTAILTELQAYRPTQQPAISTVGEA